MQQYTACLVSRPDVRAQKARHMNYTEYVLYGSSRDRLGFYAEIQIIFWDSVLPDMKNSRVGTTIISPKLKNLIYVNIFAEQEEILHEKAFRLNSGMFCKPGACPAIQFVSSFF